MSSFFNRQPEMFDAKKRLGSGNASGGVNGSDEGESAPESWVELAPSRASLCSSVEAVMVEVTGESSVNKDSRLSPVSVQSPHVEFESSLEQVKYRLAKDVLPSTKNTDWIWDWSSRPEAIPPKMMRHRSGQVGSTLTTPPNSPEPEINSDFEFKTVKSQRNSNFFRFEVIFGLVVSNLVTFVIGATIGFCICKKLSKSSSNTSAKSLSYYYW